MREFKDALPSSESAIAKFLQHYSIKSNIVVSHIRDANVGEVSLANTHPFFSASFGASNGPLPINGQVSNYQQFPLRGFQPLGTTDSEHLFCWLIAQLQRHFDACPPWQEWVAIVHSCWLKVHAQGVANMLLSNGEVLLTFCSTPTELANPTCPLWHGAVARC